MTTPQDRRIIFTREAQTEQEGRQALNCPLPSDLLTGEACLTAASELIRDANRQRNRLVIDRACLDNQR